jgi:DNA-binding NtrC family response regulator
MTEKAKHLDRDQFRSRSEDMPRTDHLSVLIVDDSEPLRAVLRRNLKHAPATIRWAGSAEEALALIEKEIPDLLVSDYRLVGALDGLSLLEAVQARHPQVRCVLHTGEPAHTTLRVSAFQVLFKPCPTEVLFELIESVRSGRSG